VTCSWICAPTSGGDTSVGCTRSHKRLGLVAQLAFVSAARLRETTDEDWDLMFDLNSAPWPGRLGWCCVCSWRRVVVGRS